MLLWMNEYLMTLHEVERARLASRERKDHRKEGLTDRKPADRDEQVYPPTTNSRR
jgi:hypothetical protein